MTLDFLKKATAAPAPDPAPAPTSVKGSFLKKPSELFPVRSPRFLLHKHLSGWQPGRTRENVHASEVTKDDGLCPRLYALFDIEAYEPPGEFLTTSESCTFEIGRMWQDALVHHFADMGRAIGHWICLSCKTRHAYCLRPEKCSCGCTAFKPEEIRFKSKVSGVSCGIDLLVKTGADKLLPLEIKTMNPEDFKELVGPLGEHRLRTNLYLRLIAESDDPFATQVDTSVGTVLYTTKGGYGVTDPDLKAKWALADRYSPFKEFAVKRDDALTEGVLKAALVVRDFRSGKVGMPRGVCASTMAKRALRCEAKAPCFSGNHPPVYDWKNA